MNLSVSRSFTTAMMIMLISLSKLDAAEAEHGSQAATFLMAKPKTLEAVKAYALGKWESISIELRPTEDRTGKGTMAPTYLRRHFSYLPGDKFRGVITLYGDSYGQLPLLEFEFKGSLNWGETHPIAEGAWQIDYILDEEFAVTPLNPDAAAMLNQVPAEGIAPFESGVKQNILKKAFPLFNIAKGQTVIDYDLIYFRNGMLFMGAKHVDGTPFDQPERRPHQLQIPLIRASK